MGIRTIVIGGGISGLSLGVSLIEKHGIEEVTVLESAGRAGGKVWTEKQQGFILEGGVNGFLDNKPGTLELASKLAMTPYRSSDNARKRFVFSGGRLNQLPESPPAFLRSPLMGIVGKLRLAMEPFIKRAPADKQETLADFGRRRLGREAFEKLIDPMASGIFAGDPEKMSLRHCFPRINALEQEYGSLIKAMIKLSIERKKNVGGGPGGTLTSFEGGLSDMTHALGAVLGERLRLGAGASSIEKLASGYRVHLVDGSVLEAEAVALACPAYSASGLVRELDKEAASAMGRVYYPPLTVVAFGFQIDRLNIPLDAFGFLIPFKEGRRILGTLYDSSVFVNRAPEGMALLRSMVGGARAPEAAELDDGRLTDMVLSELKVMTGLNTEPEFVKIFRHERAIPQYNLGHEGLLSLVEKLEQNHRGMYVTGNAYRGVSFNDCIANSMALSERIASEAGQGRPG